MDDEQKKIYIESLEIEVQFRSFSVRDYLEFNEINQSSISEKEKVKRILYSHIISPGLDYEDFDAISDSDLEALGQEFLNQNFVSNKEVNKDVDFYNYFLLIINTQQKKFTESVSKAVEPILKKNQEIIDSIRISVLPLDNYNISSIQSQITRLNESLSKFYKSIIIPSLDISESIENIGNLVSSLNQKLIQRMQHQLIDFFNWFETNKQILDPVRLFWQSFETEYGITEEKASEILKKYHWFISPSVPISLIYDIVKIDEEIESNKLAEINYLFINYFSADNWSNLDLMIDKWIEIPIFKGRRFKIIYDCVEIVKLCQSKRINAANVVVPTLISQIDGIMSEYLEMNGLSFVKPNNWINHITNETKKRNESIKDEKPQVMSSTLDELATDFLFDILFQTAYRGETPATQFYLNRNKIIHGEKYHYGRKDYLIRVLLILDFLAHIIQQTSFQGS